MAASKLRQRVSHKLRGLLRSALCASALYAATQSSVLGQQTSQWELANSNVAVDSRQPGRQAIRMVINTSREITATEDFKQVKIENDTVLTAQPIGPNRLQVYAMQAGITQIDLESADGDVHQIEVMVVSDARVLERTLQDVFPDANLTVYPVQQGCIINGSVTNANQVEMVSQIAELHFPTVINNVEVSGVFTVQLEVQILEVSRTKLRELGVDWAFSNGDDVIAQTVGGLVSATGAAFTGTGQETVRLGVIENSTSFFSGVRALRRNNLVKVLAEPKLVAVDGRPASFNSGGEVPILIPAGLGQVGVQFREFGTRLDYVAKVLGNGRIWLEVRPYVSEVDPSRSVSASGISVPGFRSRYLETGVELGAGQTLALAGLLQVKSETINLGLPVLSDMPYLGVLFRSTREEQNEIELLITVTPNFAAGLDPHQVPCALPGLGSQSPTDKELYLRGYMESPAPDGCGPNCQPGGLLPPPHSAQFEPAQVYEGGIIMPQGTQPVQNMGPQVAPQPVPAPPAMSVAPHAPRLATRPQGEFSPYYNGTDGAAGSNSATGASQYPTGGVMR